MDQNEEQTFQSSSTSSFDNYYYYFNKNNNQFLKRTFQVVISVSAVSLFMCYSTGFSLFPHSFSVYFSTLLFSFFTHTLERKYMFLICNGILAFLAKYSVFNSSSSFSSSAASSPSVFVNDGGAFSASELSQMKEPVLDAEEVVIIPVTSFEEKQERECLNGEKEIESEVFKAGQDGDVETDQSMVIQEEEEEEEEDNDDIGEAETGGVGGSEDIPSTDELNKKIEEFIRKMKEEIRIEAQQQLITVE